MTRAIQRVNAWTAKLWPELLKKPRECEDFQLHRPGQRVEFGLELVDDLYNP